MHIKEVACHFSKQILSLLTLPPSLNCSEGPLASPPSMEIEFPHDWTATKRQQPQMSQEEHPPPPGKAKRPPPEESLQADEAADACKKKNTGSTQPKMKVVKSQLGPRSVFNAVTHEAPEKGQLKQMVIAQLSKQPSVAVPKEDMDVHCLLTKLPYQKMLSDLFTHHDKEVLPSPNIPYVTRAYEESFMREPLHSTERLCAKGDLCECMFIDLENPFTSVEFLLPGEKQPTTPHLCIVCCRAVTQQLYYDIMFDKHDFCGVIQRFGNIHSQPG